MSKQAMVTPQFYPSVNAHDANGNTAMKLTLGRGYKDMAVALQKAGAKE